MHEGAEPAEVKRGPRFGSTIFMFLLISFSE